MTIAHAAWLAPARIAAWAACLCLASCAATGTFDPPPQGPGSARTPAGQALSPQAAIDSIAIGKSSKADVSAAIGQAVVIAFDSGYEVWVYRWGGAEKTTRAATELVVLFDRAGVAMKARVREGYSGTV